MANRYWVGDGGNWSDNVTHWSASTGGAPGASLPTSADSVYYDANSFTIPGQTVTVDTTAYCLAMNWTGATNTPTLAGSILSPYGNVTFIADMVVGPLTIYFLGNGILTTNGLTLSATIAAYLSGNVTLGDNLTTTGPVRVRRRTINTAGFTVNCASFNDFGDAVAHTVTLGNSTINCTEWGFGSGGLTLTANTATINVSGTGAFAGGGIATYNDVNLIGSAHTVSGDFTCDTLALPSGTTQTITFTAGEVITCTTATLDGDATHAHTIKSGTAGTLASLIATAATDDYVTYTDMRLSWGDLTVGSVLIYDRMLSFAVTENIRMATLGRLQL